MTDDTHADDTKDKVPVPNAPTDDAGQAPEAPAEQHPQDANTPEPQSAALEVTDITPTEPSPVGEVIPALEVPSAPPDIEPEPVAEEQADEQAHEATPAPTASEEPAPEPAPEPVPEPIAETPAPEPEPLEAPELTADATNTPAPEEPSEEQPEEPAAEPPPVAAETPTAPEPEPEAEPAPAPAKPARKSRAKAQPAAAAGAAAVADSAESAVAVAEPAEPVADSKKKWYVVKVQSGREESIKAAIERKVKIEGLEEFFGEIVIPVEEVVEKKKVKVKDKKTGEVTTQEKNVTKKKKKFHGYLFANVEFNDRILYLFRETSGVGDFVGVRGPHTPPDPMPEHEVQAMLTGVSGPTKGGKPKTKVKLDFEKGDKVRIREGAFANNEGEVKAITEPKDPTDSPKVTVVVTIWGRPVDVELEYWQVDKV